MVTTASNVWMSINEQCFLDPGRMRPGLEISLLVKSSRLIQEKAHCCLKRGQRTLFCVKRRESTDVPEDIVADWSLRFPRSATATGTPRKPFSVWTILLCIAVYGYMCSGEHIL